MGGGVHAELRPDAYQIAERVVVRVRAELKPVAFLSMVIENTEVTRGELAFFGVNESVLDAIDVLVRDSYELAEDYIERIAVSGNEAAIVVQAARLALAAKMILDGTLGIPADLERNERFRKRLRKAADGLE